jgi:RimJ/RimL family protein N-acetyltransferase
MKCNREDAEVAENERGEGRSMSVWPGHLARANDASTGETPQHMSSALINTLRGIVTVRRAIAEDAQRLRALRLEALTNHPTSFGTAAEEIDQMDWTKRAAGDANEAVNVAEHDGQLVGMTGIFRNTRLKDSHFGFIWGVYVRPAYRGCGVARALVTAAVEWARDAGVAIVKLTVVPESGARACYERCGFLVTGTDVAALKWDGRYYDELIMSRWIVPPSKPR